MSSLYSLINKDGDLREEGVPLDDPKSCRRIVELESTSQMAGIALSALKVLLMLLSVNAYIRNIPLVRSSVRHIGILRGVPQELLIYGGGEPPAAVKALIKLRPGIKLVENTAQVAPITLERGAMLWSFHKDSMQLDCTDIEDMYLGRHKLDAEETATKWDEIMAVRRKLFASSQSVNSGDVASIPLGDGGRLQAELDTAIRAVQRASFMSRSIQHSLILGKTDKRDGSGSLSKDDKSPVTIADFAVQALVIDALSKAFPNDNFIAEEDSKLLRDDQEITALIVKALNQASDADDSNGQAWDVSRLYATIDKGDYSGTTEQGRVWVLDPVDGTKGFMRGEHYCIALALLEDGNQQLSTLGCPNVQLLRALDGIEGAHKANTIVRGVDLHSSSSDDSGRGSREGPVPVPHAYPSTAGCIFFAVTGQGAFARSLAMQPGAAVEVNVECPLQDHSKAVLCESVEASHGDRNVTQRVFASLQMSSEYVRLDGQCKYAIVGAGAAHGNMRLPPSGYVEKIWDHAPGAHFVTEAGGRVSDLGGNALDFSTGRYMHPSVTGIVASHHAKLHQNLLNAIAEAKAGKERENTRRTYLDD